MGQDRPTSQPGPAKQRAVTWRSAAIALVLVLLWTVGTCYMAVGQPLFGQQFLMVLGFGAILTVFLLQFPTVFLVSVVLLWGGSYVLMYRGAGAALRPQMLAGILRSLPAFLLVVGMALWIKLRPLRRAEMVVIYACVLIAVPWCVAIKAVIESSTANLFEVMRKAEPQMYVWSRQMPWWGPTLPRPEPPRIPPKPALPPDATEEQIARAQHAYERAMDEYRRRVKEDALERHRADRLTQAAVEGFANGNGGRVPWRLWWRPMLFWVATCLSYEAMLMGILLLFRRRWLEHERLPFVWAQPALHILRAPSWSARRRWWVAFVAGLGICLPAIIFVGPAGEQLSNWTVPPWVGQWGIRGGVDLTELNILPKTPLQLMWGPMVLAMLLLFPVDVLMTVALVYIVLNILVPGLMRAFGLELGPREVRMFVKWGVRFGGCAGLLIWSSVFALWDWLRARRQGFQVPARASDRLGPTWAIAALALAGLVGFVALGTYSTNLVQMLLLTGFVLIYAFAQVRQRTEGQIVTYENNIASHQMVSIQRDFLHDHYGLARDNPGMRITPDSWATHWLQWGFVGQLKSLGPHNMLLEAFKIGHELKVHARTIAKAVLVTMLIVALVTPLLYVQLMYIYGFSNSFQGELATWVSFTQWSERSESYGFRSTSKVFWLPTSKTGWGGFYEQYRNIFNAIYGVLLVGGLFYLRREFPRFPLSPVGFVLAAEASNPVVPYTPEHIWFSFLLAWIIKSLIFRWLGVRSFREKIQPAVIMFLCGIIFGMMMHICRYVALGLGRLK